MGQVSNYSNCADTSYSKLYVRATSSNSFEWKNTSKHGGSVEISIIKLITGIINLDIQRINLDL